MEIFPTLQNVVISNSPLSVIYFLSLTLFEPRSVEAKSVKVIYKHLNLNVPKDVYKPAEDTFLLADNLKAETGEKILELGTGCGLLSIIAAKRGAKVTATDINPKAMERAKENAKSEGVLEKIDFRWATFLNP